MLSWLIFRNYLLSRRSGALVRIIARHSIIGIGMGVAALLIVLSVMNGFNLTIRNRMLSIEPHLVVMLPKTPTRADLAKFTRVVRRLGLIDEVVRFSSQDVIIRSLEGTFGGAMAKGYDPTATEDFLNRAGRQTKAGESRSYNLKPDEVILGMDLARSLGIFEGDEIVMIPPETLLMPKGEIPHFQKYRVKSLVETNLTDVDAKLLLYDIDAAKKTLSMESGYEIRLRDPYQADAMKAQLVHFGYKVQTWMERDTSLFFALKMESFAMTLFLSLAVLITSFSIVTVMVLLMSQKRQDIGLFRTMGLSLAKTRMVFLRVGLLLSFLGILGGTLIGTTICLTLDWYPLELLPDIYTDSTLPAKLTMRILLFVLGSSSLIAIVGSWLPVWRSMVLTPSESLRKNPT